MVSLSENLSLGESVDICSSNSIILSFSWFLSCVSQVLFWKKNQWKEAELTKKISKNSNTLK